MPRSATATQALPLVPRAIEGGIVTLPGPRYRAVLETGAISLGRLHPRELAGLAGAYHGFLAGLAFPVQVLVRVQPANPAPYLQWYRVQTAEQAATDPALGWLVSRHLAHVAHLVATTSPLAYRFHVVVPAPEAGFAAVTAAGRLPQAALRLLRRRRADDREAPAPASPGAPAAAGALGERCDLVIAALQSIGLPVRRLNDMELAALWHTCLCPGNAALQPLPPDSVLAPLQPVTTLQAAPPRPSAAGARSTE